MTRKPPAKQFQPGRGYTQEDWDAVDSPELTDEELAGMKPAREVLPPEFFKALDQARRARGRPALENPKQKVTLRLDAEVLARLRASGPGWQSRVNETLRKVVGL